MGNNSPIINRLAIKKQEELEMKKSLVIGAATLAITAMVGTGFGYASSKDVKDESTLAVESTPAVRTTLPIGATAEEIEAFEKEVEVFEKEMKEIGIPEIKTTPAKKATAEEIASFEKESKGGTPVTKSVEASKK